MRSQLNIVSRVWLPLSESKKVREFRLQTTSNLSKDVVLHPARMGRYLYQ